MRASKKLSKSVIEIINDINTYLRLRHISDQNSELFQFGIYFLIKKNMYHGYNKFVMFNEHIITEAGTEKFNAPEAFLQIYTGPAFEINRNV